MANADTQTGRGRKRCPHCNRVINGHPNKKFCGPRCKDRFHNRTNPRGFYAHLNTDSPEWDPEDDEHPFSDHALGQT